jgi:hypothetical protein
MLIPSQEWQNQYKNNNIFEIKLNEVNKFGDFTPEKLVDTSSQRSN